MNSAHETEFQWMTLCFFVTSITAIVEPLDTAPTMSLTSSCRMSFSALRTAGAGLVSSSSEMISILWPSTPPLAFSSSTAIWMAIVWYFPYPSKTPTFEPRSPILTTFWAAAGAASHASTAHDASTARTVLFLMSPSLGGEALDQPRHGPRDSPQRFAHLFWVGRGRCARRHRSRLRSDSASRGCRPALGIAFSLVECQADRHGGLRVVLTHGKVNKVVVAPNRLEVFPTRCHPRRGGLFRVGKPAVGVEGKVPDQHGEEDHEIALDPRPVAGAERGARGLLQARRQARGLRTHRRAEGAGLEEAQRDVEFPGLDRELDLLEVGRDFVVARDVGADVMGCRRTARAGDEHHGQQRGGEPHQARRTRRAPRSAASHQAATIVAPPKGIHTSHSATVLPVWMP